MSDEYYVRDVSGKEIAIYSGSSLTQWNIWGLDNVGKINSDTTRNYYLKDHLGSIRVVLNSANQVISPQDYDAWGYPLENRSYNGYAMKYDFICLTPDLQPAKSVIMRRAMITLLRGIMIAEWQTGQA